MTAQTRRYFVRARTAVAGSLIAAASLTGVGVAPSVAASPTVIRPQADDGTESLRGSGAAGPVSKAAAERLDGVRAELTEAVSMRMVTSEQADRFYAQLERRIRSGL